VALIAFGQADPAILALRKCPLQLTGMVAVRGVGRMIRLFEG
jgi:hypothetical protein